MDGDASFGHWLTLRRKALRLSCVEVARRVGCATVTLRKIEADERRPSRAIAERLAVQLGLPPGQQTVFTKVARAELRVDWLLPPGEMPAAAPALLPSPRRRALTLPPTPLIGRAADVAAVRDHLMRTEVRLLTLVGAPGIGKTRLALQVATELRDTFADGVIFIPLAPIRDPGLVLPTIAQALEISEMPSQPVLERLQAYLRDRHTLLVLDNFEQVLKAAPLIAELLAEAPRLTLLVTSRVALHLSGEHRFAVPPLALPDVQRLTADSELAATLGQYAAVELFAARARALAPGFALTDANAAAVATICARLDGLPLAIELAAARIKLFTPAELLARLDRRLTVLTGGALDLPTRQQTLRRAIDWSYDLLDPPEQMLLRRLGVFVGGCTLEAAERVCNAAGDPSTSSGQAVEMDVPDGLMALIDKSLLQREAGGDDRSRFGMLETIREYALERLEQSGEIELLRQRHAEHYLALAEQAEPELEGSHQTVWLDRLESDHANLCAALEWAVARGKMTTALRLGGSLWQFWAVRGHASEGRRWLEVLLTRVSSLDTALLGKVLYGAALMAWAQGDYPSAYEINSRYLALSRSLGDQQGIALALHGLGLATAGQRDYRRASEYFEAGLTFARQLGHRRRIAGLLFNLGCVVCEQGNYERAKALLEESLKLGQETRDAWVIAWALHFLALVAREQADFERAGSYYQQSLALLRELGARQSIARSLSGLAGVAGRQGLALRAARLFGAADAFFKASRETNHEQDRFERDLAYTRAQLDEATFAAAWAEGRAMPLEQTIAEALDH